MKLPDISRLNDWEIKKFLKTILIIQFLVLIVIFLDFENLIPDFKLPPIRQIIVFVYLTFIPGFLVLRVLRVHNLDPVENLCYSVGLSLAVITFSALIANFICPILGIRPIKLEPQILTIFCVFILLILLAYLRDKDYGENKFFEVKFSFQFIFLLLLPLTTILGVYFLDYYYNNYILIILMILVCFIVLVYKIFHTHYLLAVWVISISLLFHISLPTPYIRLSDNFLEVGYISEIITEGFWNPNHPSHLYTMASVTLPLSIYSILLDLNIISLYKFFVPFLYSLVPVTLFLVYRKHIGEELAFLSVFFFISFYEFYTWAGITAKITLSGIFLAMLLLLFYSKRVNNILKIIFAVMIVLSHYGTAYILIFCLILSYFIGSLVTKNNIKEVSFNFISFFVAFAIFWYLFTSSGVWFEAMIKIGNHIVISVNEWLFIPEDSHLGKIVSQKISISLEILKTLVAISTIFIFLGFLTKIFENKIKLNFYENLSLSFILILAIPFVGYASGAVTIDRIFHLASYVLSPFFILGCLSIEKTRFKLKKLKLKYFIQAFLILFFLTNVGFISEIFTKDFPGASVVLSKDRIVEQGTLAEKQYIGQVFMRPSEASSISWLSYHYDNRFKIFADSTGASKFRYISDLKVLRYMNDNEYKNKGGYLYLCNFNVRERILASKTLIYSENSLHDSIKFSNINNNIIYSNLNSSIFFAD